MLEFRPLPVGLQNVNDSNEQQEALTFTTHSWNTTHTTDREQEVISCVNDGCIIRVGQGSAAQPIFPSGHSQCHRKKTLAARKAFSL